MLLRLPSINHIVSGNHNIGYEIHPQTRDGGPHEVTDTNFIFKSFEQFQQTNFTTVESSSVTSAAIYDTTEVGNSSVSPTMQPLLPSLPSTIQTSLTCVYISMFSLIFLLVYVQLWMIWYYRHRRLSHQTFFLFLCLIWAGLRTTLFSFYIRDSEAVNHLGIGVYWLLNSLPVCLQFCMLCLLLHFILQVVLRARASFEPRQCMHSLHIFIGASVLLYTTVSFASAVLTKQYKFAHSAVPIYLGFIRVIMSEVMFFIYGVLLSISIFKMAKVASTQRVLEAKGTTIRKALLAAILITLLFLTRAVYNLISMCPPLKGTPNFSFDWVNISDKADVVVRLPESIGYVSFGVVLFVWEVLPISVVVLFFRVKRLSTGQLLTNFSTQISGPRVFFFDNPRRYDSDDDLISPPSSSNMDTTGSHSYSSDSFLAQSAGRTPVNSSLRTIMGASPLLKSYPRATLSLPGTSPLLGFKRGSSYGAVAGEGYIHTGSRSAYGANSK
ncbi:unnamed protein product [Candidula unifasciata]|uniref:Integral membrane protein GPR137B-like n=1 Tax=Candidula unifasciata TaxID=100452 RepID=A0A8S3ZJN0_9EUPU|nr:unnamed protein product [Candidula unifasciata]